jgi:meso-butanediol dehydrogenase/(S,S)-butanediol dehydrogenase/diacetyl reductase
MSMRRFDDKVVLITGAASGIGRATAERLASEGAALLCVDVQAKGLAETVGLLTAAGATAHPFAADLADPASPRAAVAACMKHFGKIDVLCNVAGILRMDITDELELANWNRVIAVNLTATFLMCKEAIPHLLLRGGNIVNVSSTSALQGMPWGAAYGSSKAGVLALTRGLAVEYAGRGLRANAVCPGSIETPMTNVDMLPKGIDMKLLRRMMPLDRARGPETVASVIAMLASSDGAHINGEFIRIDGGTLA